MDQILVEAVAGFASVKWRFGRGGEGVIER